MGYTLTIGEATVDSLPSIKEIVEDWDGKVSSRISINPVFLDEAPADGSPTDHTNQCWPSYTAWGCFVDQVGLRALFFDENGGLLRSHPGCYALTPAHLATIEAVGASVPEDQRPRYDWLLFWVRWALANCKTPAIKNT